MSSGLKRETACHLFMRLACDSLHGCIMKHEGQHWGLGGSSSDSVVTVIDTCVLEASVCQVNCKAHARSPHCKWEFRGHKSAFFRMEPTR